MRLPGDVSEADVESDAGSSRSEEKCVREKNEAGNPMRNNQEDSNSRPGSQKSGRSLRNEEPGEPNYGSDSSSGSHKPSRNSINPAPYTDQERAELVRRLDSIKEQLLRGSNSIDKPKEPDQPPMPFIGPGKHVPGPPYFHPYPEPFPYAGGNPMPMHGMYPSTSKPMHIPGYRDPFGFQMQRRPANWYPGHYPNQMTHPYLPGQYVDIGPDIFEPHPQDPLFHPYFPATPSRFGDIPYSPVSHHHEKVGPFSPHSYSSSRNNAPSLMGSSGSQGPARWPSDLDSEMGGAFARGYVQKAVSATDTRRCHPLAGGAPFIACHNCFELLYLPKKARLIQEKQQKLQCGACSQVISFTIVNKKLVLSSGHVETNPVSKEVEASSTSAVVKDSVLNSHGHVSQPSGNFSSVDYDNSGYDFHCMDEEPAEEPRKPLDLQNVHACSPSEHSEDEEKSKSSNRQREVVSSVQHRPKDAKVSQPTSPHGSSLLELFEYSNVNRAALSYGMAALGFHSKKDESYVTQNSLKAESVATETDVSFNGYSNTEVSEDPMDATGREEDSRPRSRKGSGSGFVEVLQRGQSEERGKSSEVWVNGHLIPEDLLTNAEKSAGPIQPGNYWYDYRAGFWGVMGKPCLGIIPPFIEEFSHPMPDNCAGGNTGILVNGRELHQRDLDLLAGRGLPRDRNRSYIIDIAGRVLDGDSGEELDCLGKLAPTIEKVKHGFGMRVPRTLAY